MQAKGRRGAYYRVVVTAALQANFVARILPAATPITLTTYDNSSGITLTSRYNTSREQNHGPRATRRGNTQQPRGGRLVTGHRIHCRAGGLHNAA
jgi:hypothetical protein